MGNAYSSNERKRDWSELFAIVAPPRETAVEALMEKFYRDKVGEIAKSEQATANPIGISHPVTGATVSEHKIRMHICI